MRTFQTKTWDDEHSCTLLETLLGKPFCSEHRIMDSFAVLVLGCIFVNALEIFSCFGFPCLSSVFKKIYVAPHFLENASIRIELNPQFGSAQLGFLLSFCRQALSLLCFLIRCFGTSSLQRTNTFSCDSRMCWSSSVMGQKDVLKKHERPLLITEYNMAHRCIYVHVH